MVRVTDKASLPSRMRSKVRGAGNPKPAPANQDKLRQRVNELSRQVKKLNERVLELDDELLDARSQGRRIGEISDLVTELLVNEASRRDPEFQRIVDKYLSE